MCIRDRLRTALGEERAIAVARALEHAQIKGETELAAKRRQEWRNDLAAAVAPLARREELAEIRKQIAQLPNREELKRFATHEDCPTCAPTSCAWTRK